jgi:aldose 1-epimerase
MELDHGPWRLLLDPARGASFIALTHEGRDILAPAGPGDDPSRGPRGAFWMAPWTNRLDAGRIEADGVVHHMPITRPAENNALHGFARDAAWAVEASDRQGARLGCTIAHAPFAARMTLDIRLSEGGLVIAATLANTGAAPTPMGFGWHPWFARPPGTRLAFRARTVFGRDVRNLPRGPRPSAGFAGADRALDGLDTHFAGWDGRARLTHPDGFAFDLVATGAWAGNLQVYAPTGGGVLCVEPVTHAPDAANNPVAAAHGPMHRLAPGQTLAAALRLEAGAHRG